MDCAIQVLKDAMTLETVGTRIQCGIFWALLGNCQQQLPATTCEAHENRGAKLGRTAIHHGKNNFSSLGNSVVDDAKCHGSMPIEGQCKKLIHMFLLQDHLINWFLDVTLRCRNLVELMLI